jgi:hypothetical protein
MRSCHHCEGDGYTEEFNDEQSGVVITPCPLCAATGVENAGVPIGGSYERDYAAEPRDGGTE